jgi:probable rRNA maturation factor
VSVKVEVAVQPGQEKLCGPAKDLVKAVLTAEKAKGLISVAFVDEPEMADLNALYRGVDSSTDVLSFGQEDGGVGWPNPTRSRDAELGEVVVCPAVVARYAGEEGGDADRQMGWTLIHGVLHLLGYDHEKGSGEMRTREQVLLGELERKVLAISKAARG